MALEITPPNVLVVEGRDAELFFGALIKHLGWQNIQIMPIGGKEQLRRNLKALVLSPHFSEVLALGGGKRRGCKPAWCFSKRL